MKAFRILVTFISISSLVSYSSCKSGGGSSETTQDKQLGLLSKTWKISTVTLESVDQTSKWPSFQLTMTGTKGATSFDYTCAGRPTFSPWPPTGKWAFGTDPVTQIIRDPSGTDIVPMTYTVTATTLQINFNYTGPGYARISSVAGNWVFNFTN